MGKAKLPPADDDGPETTSRLYEADGQDLKQLAALLDLKNAEGATHPGGGVSGPARMAASTRRAADSSVLDAFSDHISLPSWSA